MDQAGDPSGSVFKTFVKKLLNYCKVGHRNYNVIMRISPIKALDENWENVASS